jgi:bifunctional DNA-binding transcriptional regulator/antitoxin component of YhaV-PrlF toxin-antitoxin module
MYIMLFIDKYRIMYYHVCMTYLVSISDRGLVYIPRVVQKKMHFNRHMKIELIEEGGQITLKPVKDIMEFAGMGKDKAKFEYWKNFREKMETEYEEIS